MKYHFKIYKEEDGYWAKCLELDGCITQADTLEELYENMKDALETYMFEPEGSTFQMPPPDPSIKTSETVVEISADL